MRGDSPPTGENENSNPTPPLEPHRRTFLKGAALTTAGVSGLRTYTGSVGAEGTEQAGPIAVGVFGGIFEEMYRTHLIEPFQEATDIEVQVSTIGNVPELLQLKRLVDQGRAPVDVLIHTTEALPQGVEMDLYAPLPAEEMPNLDNLFDRYRFQHDGTTYGAGIGAWFMSMILHSEQVEEPYPSSWEAWWDDRFEGRAEASSALTDSYLPWITAELFFDGQEVLQTQDGIDEVFEEMQGVKPQIAKWYENEAQGQQDIRNGEVSMIQMWNDVSIVMENEGDPVRRVMPDEGMIGDHGEWVVLQSSDNKQAAFEFINYSLRPDVQTTLSQNLFTAPTTENTNLSAEEKEKVFGPGPDAHIKPDWTPLFEHEEYIRDKWNRFIA